MYLYWMVLWGLPLKREERSCILYCGLQVISSLSLRLLHPFIESMHLLVQISSPLLLIKYLNGGYLRTIPILSIKHWI